MEVFTEFFASGEFWETLIKVLTTALLSAGVGLIGTLIGKSIAKHKDSKIYKYAKTCVEAAEMKYPNEGKKMGPEKMAYVMDQMAIKFPKIKESTYFYNLAEAAVLELNSKMKEEVAIKEFEEKYGEKPLAALDGEEPAEEVVEEEITEEIVEEPIVEEVVERISESKVELEPTTKEEVVPKKNTSIGKLRSF